MAVETVNNIHPDSGSLLLKSPDTIPEDGGHESKFDGEHTRETWSRKSEYVLSLVGFSVGLGNIWRFPYVCMRNGGGAFLIPFLVSLVVCALPVFFLETALGQFLGKSPLHVWNICPLFKGIGISMNILCVFVAWYYGMILAWCCVYLVHSFRSPLPWTLCNQAWNTPACIETFGMAARNESRDGMTSYNASHNLPLGDAGNFTGGMMEKGPKAITASNEFWLNNVLELSTGLEDVGGLQWPTALALVVAHAVCLLSIIKGVRTSGKVVYITATLPYILLTVMLIVGVMQPGSFDGIIYYIKPDFSKLMDVNTWVEAFIQIFFSLGISIGGLITMASYNKFNNNCMRDSIMLVLVCEGTSLYGGFAIFSILGHMAFKSNIPIEDFAKSGAGLAFIVYPEAMSYLPLPQLWAVLFFLMLFSLGLDSQFVHFETLLTTMSDLYPKFTSRWRKSITTLTVGSITLLGFVFATRGGMYLFQLVDWYFAAFTYIIQAALECIIVAWIYGTDRFCRDIELMIGRKPPYIFVVCWKFISPGLLLLMFLVTLIYHKPPEYEGYHYTKLAEVFGWIFAVMPFSSVVVFAFWKILTSPGSLSQRLKNSCTPNEQWRPSSSSAREKYKMVNYKEPELSYEHATDLMSQA